jgi:ribonucleoside-diphosphate reductase alpha chain
MSDVLRDRLVILATPALMSLGNPYTKRHGYFSCYPLGHVEDTLSGIELTHQKMRTIYTAGGGVGIDLSKLRPNGSPVDNGQGTASGPVGFLPDFDSVTGTTNQGGRRRGALLVQLDWEHPDIRDFVQIKNFNHTFNRLIQQLPPEERPSKGFSLTNMNISVNVYGKFWENDQLIDLIARNMWATGDPGLLFVDNMIKHSPFPADLEPKFSNPCGEYLAPAGSACNLVTVNVAKLATEAQNKTHFFSFTVQHGPNRLRFGQYHVGYG